MKQSLKNEIDMLDLINKIQTQLIGLDKKVDTLINRSVPETKAPSKPPVDTNRRMMHTAICADCKKECTIPFKPSGDRPVYCQDCFSRRKVIRLSGMHVEEKPPVNVEEPPVKQKKKVVSVKKPVAKKKLAPKKK
jgi:CxxC-x17-CxxC domain-containing protein